MTDAIAVVLASIITVGFPFIVNGYRQKKRTERRNLALNAEINKLLEENKVLAQEKKDLIAHEITGDLVFFSRIKDIVESLFEKTKVDRFLILTGHNGSQELTFATAIYEHHKANPKILLSIGATRKYKGFKFDQPYKNMIKTSEKYGYIDYDVTKMEECDLKEIFLTEGIKHARILFLLRAKVDETNDIVFFASLATRDVIGFSKREKLILKVEGDLLIGLFSKVESERLKEANKAEKELVNLNKIEEELNGKQGK